MSELGVKRLTVGVRAGAHTMDTPVTVHITEDPVAQGDPRSDPVVVDWLADGRLDVSRALADGRFATGLDQIDTAECAGDQRALGTRTGCGPPPRAGGALRARTAERGCANDVELCSDRWVASEYHQHRAASPTWKTRMVSTAQKHCSWHGTRRRVWSVCRDFTRWPSPLWVCLPVICAWRTSTSCSSTPSPARRSRRGGSRRMMLATRRLGTDRPRYRPHRPSRRGWRRTRIWTSTKPTPASCG